MWDSLPPDCVVLALPRGGVPVGYEVAIAHHRPLDVIIVRKLGVPGHLELAMGALGEGGVRVINEDVARSVRADPDQVEAVEARERDELTRRVERYRGGRAPVSFAGRPVVIVDDGIATGATARAACIAARAQGASHVTLAAPVAPPAAVEAMREVADAVVVVHAPARLRAIGEFYVDFTPTTDAEVLALLALARAND
jgi:predicted phosphoribosyltransferase